MSLKTMSRNNPQKSPGDLMKNLETPGKTGRVNRYAKYPWPGLKTKNAKSREEHTNHKTIVLPDV